MNKQSQRHLYPAVVVLVLSVAWSLPAWAQEQTVSGRPALDGHGFTESVDVPSPFVRSFIRNRVGAGKSLGLRTPVREAGGVPVGGFEGSLIFAILDFEYQYAIKPWVAVHVGVSGGGRLGSDTLALLSDGVTMMTGFELGWLIRLHERQSTALSLDLGLSDRSFTGVNITRFVDEIIAGDPAALVRKTPSARVGAGLRFAWAASPLLGVSASGQVGNGESVDRSQSDAWFVRLAGALDFDLRTKMSAPLGLAVGFSYDSFPEFGEDIADGVYASFVRFSYLGRDDFLVSVDLSHNRIPVAGDRPDVKAASVTISLRYYL